MKNSHLGKVALMVGFFLVAVTMSSSAGAASLRQGSNAAVAGALPGEVLWGSYMTEEKGILCPPNSNVTTDVVCNTAALGDNILRLINPNGAANANLAGAEPQTVCAMIYVFDDDEEMGECCGCPLSSTRLATFSVEKNLTLDWALQGGPENGEHDNGAIAVVASAPNAL